ncbi:MAG: glucohydrolase, partial [Lachnospiraceae bacterium]|nr:glucohydrolase [Lachnospiraceae bacterium]
QWSGEANAGFTTGKPWLKVNPNYTSINAADQLDDPDSVRSFYKELIALRKDPDYKETVVYGELKPYLEEQHNLMAYYRKGEQTLLVIGNYQMEEQTVELPSEYHSEYKKILLNNYPELVQEGTTLILHGYQAVVLEM